MSAVLKPSDFVSSAEQRYNIYTVIHKSLRGFMTDTLLAWGRVDVSDAQELEAAIAQVRGLLDMCAGHLHHENEFVHPALEAVQSGAAAQTRHEHVEHEAAIAELRTHVLKLEAAHGVQRAELAQQLYLQLSAFVAENFAHMIVEETENHAVLIGAYSDAEILAIEHRIVASLTPEQSLAGMRLMLSHMNASERAAKLSGIKRNAPPPVFNAVLQLAREVLSERDFNKLEAALAK
jgi:hypothetical protein